MARKKISKAEKKRRELAAWHRRYYWPAIIIAVDPGRTSGVVVFESHRRTLIPIFKASVDTHSRALDDAIAKATDHASRHYLPVVLMMESWGKGGPLGIEQWLGLGEARGIWRRAFTLGLEDAEEEAKRDGEPYKVGGVKLFVPARFGYVHQAKWRSKMIPETGTTDADGNWQRFDTDGWKDAAIREVCRLTGWHPSRVTGDEAEAFLIGRYAARSDALGKLLPATHLSRFRLQFPPLPAPEPGKPKLRRKKK